MAGYDFSALSPHEFEELTRDLLEKKHGIPFQAFTEGPDGGIDLRHAYDSNKQCIVQCKHFSKSRYSSLKSHIKKELRKIQKLNPKRYILVTSLGLTPKNVDDLFDLLRPYCISKHDIIGKEDLNGFLRDFPQVEKSHFKLWITSERVLSRILQNDVMVQSSMTEAEIRQRLSLYVYTSMFNKASEKLNSDGVCIISGIPGVGKTTLAEMLLVEHVMNDWEIVTIQQNVSEGLRALREDPKAKQIFYYDDFLGQIKSGEKLAKNEDRSLIQLIRSVATSKSKASSKPKRFVLTTREYILAQAKAEHEQLAREDLDLYRFVIECDDYNEESKARIFANHLYFYGVPQRHIAAIVKNERYHEIIRHKNYNPRIIESMTRTFDPKSCAPSKYPDEFIKRLDDPKEIWRYAYDHLTNAARHLLLALVTCKGPVYASDLKKIFESFWIHRSSKYGFQRNPNDFRQSLDELEGNFIQIQIAKEGNVIDTHNPSVLDFIQTVLIEESETIDHILESSIFFEQIVCLHNTLGVLMQSENVTNKSNHLLSDSMKRTFSHNDLTISKISYLTKEWKRNSNDQWRRLQTCIRIADKVDNTHVRKFVEDTALDFFRKLSDSDSFIDKYIDTFEMLLLSDWLHESVCQELKILINHKFLSKDGFSKQRLEDLYTASFWLYEYKEDYTVEGFDKVIGLLSKKITSIIEQLTREESDIEELESAKSTLDEIASCIPLNVSYEEDLLDEAIEKCELNAPFDDNESLSSSPKTVSDLISQSTIKSIFNSLLR